jgi:hypothetical protein
MKIDEQSIANLTAQEKELLSRLLNAVMQPKNVPPDWTDEKEGRFLMRLEDGTLREKFNDLMNALPPVSPTSPMVTVTLGAKATMRKWEAEEKLRAELDQQVREYLKKTGGKA